MGAGLRNRRSRAAGPCLLMSLAIAVGMGGCYLLEPVPGRQLNVIGTSWSVVEIDHAQVAAGAPLVFRWGDDQVTVETGCRTLRLEYALDTDGAGLGFAASTVGRPSCAPNLAEQDVALLSALAGIETWTVHSSDDIEFLGTHQLRLKRLH